MTGCAVTCLKEKRTKKKKNQHSGFGALRLRMGHSPCPNKSSLSSTGRATSTEYVL